MHAKAGDEIARVYDRIKPIQEEFELSNETWKISQKNSITTIRLG